MRRVIVTTADGSKTIHLPELAEHYHSIHGAIQEACHVFIDMGLKACPSPSVHILEMGFGTGLNALLTFLETQRGDQRIHYTAWEAHPVSSLEAEQMEYPTTLGLPESSAAFKKMHTCSWGKPHNIAPGFVLTKVQADIRAIQNTAQYDLIYFDAFSPGVQPELWTEGVFVNMYSTLKNDGILVTYSAKGAVRRAMLSAGFMVERLPGPPGKREMLRARKLEKVDSAVPPVRVHNSGTG